MKVQLQKAVAEFLDRVCTGIWEGGDLDGGDVSGWLLKAGLLNEITVTQKCGENCLCADFGVFPTTCNEKNYEAAP